MAKRIRNRSPRDSAIAPVGSRQPARVTGGESQTVAELQNALRARDDFLAIAAHELMNPITPIQLCVEAMRMALQSHDYRKVHQHADRLDRLLRHFLQRASIVLDVARLTTSELKLEFAEFELSELVRSTIDALSQMLARSGSELHTSIQENVTCVLDRMSVIQILENLLSNAIKYGEGKSIEVSLSADAESAEIAVRDHGIGISDDDKQRIFGRFERAVGPKGQPGFGIGLWVSSKLAESMGGSIEVTSEKGAGSLFKVKLPLEGK